MFKRFFFTSRPLLLVALLLASLSVSFLQPLVANAASPYDNLIHKIDTLVLTNQSGYQVDVSTNWQTYVQSTCTDPSVYGDMLAAFDHGNWAVTRYHAYYQSGDKVYVQWTSNKNSGSTDLNWTTDHSTVETPGNTLTGYATFYLNGTNITGDGCGLSNNPQDRTIGFSRHDEQFAYDNFLSTYNPNYPPDYAGELIPQGGAQKEVVSPRINYVVENRKVTLTYDNNVKLTGCAAIDYGVSKKTVPDTMLDTKFNQSLSLPYTYEVPKNDDYTFIAQLQTPVPCAPFPETQDVKPTVLNLTIDGSNFTGSTDDLTCTMTGGFNSCLTPSPLEDCSTYGTDIVGALACHVRNFGTGFILVMKKLFVPTTGNFSDLFGDMNTFFADKFGFLYQSVAFVFGTIGSMISGAANPTPHLIPEGTYFGKSVDLDISQASSVIGQAGWDMILMIIRSITAVAIMYGLWRTYLGFVSESKE